MKERDLIIGGISLVLISQIILGAFSLETRKQIYERARKKNGRLQSEKSGRNDEPLECAHIDHDPRKMNYDHPSNGRLLTLSEHLQDHINRAGRNGLTKDENDWAIEQIRKRIREFRGE